MKLTFREIIAALHRINDTQILKGAFRIGAVRVIPGQRFEEFYTLDIVMFCFVQIAFTTSDVAEVVINDSCVL